MRPTNLTFCQTGDEIKPLTTNEVKPLSEVELCTLSTNINWLVARPVRREHVKIIVDFRGHSDASWGFLRSAFLCLETPITIRPFNT